MATGTARPDTDRPGLVHRLGALTGAASVVVAYAGISMGDTGGRGINPTMAPEAILRGLQADVDGFRLGASLLSLGAVLAAVFAGPLWSRLRCASEWVAVVGVAGAVLAAAQWLSLAADGISLATAADLGDALTAQVLLTTGWESARTAAVPTLAMVAAAVIAAVGHRVFPRWFAWFSVATLVPLVLALTPVGPSGLLGFAFGGLWVLVTSVLLAMESPSRAADPRSTADQPST